MKGSVRFRECRRTQLVTVLLTAVSLVALAACGDKVPDLPAPTVAGTIAFGGNDIEIVRTDGADAGKVFDPDAYLGGAAWSPDAAKIAYVSQAGDAAVTHVLIANADGGGAHEVAVGKLGGQMPTWSPEGTRIAYVNWWYPPGVYPPGHVFVIGVDGSGQRQLTNGPDYDVWPQWTPDGQSILFLRRPKEPLNNPEGDVYSVRSEGGGLAKVTSLGEVSGFALSPDGTLLAVADRKAHRIVLLPFGSSGPARTLIASDYGWTAVGISWSPDGKALVLGNNAYDHSLPSRLVVVNDDGSGLSAIPDVTGFGPAWRPQ
jgi:Tol biopolymer transport system component